MSQLPIELTVPDQRRRLRFSATRWLGVAAIALIPLLALAGTFGETDGSVEHRAGDIALRVDYPVRYRYKQIHTLRVEVENLSGTTIDTIVVTFDSSYTSRFSQVMIMPSPRVPFEVVLTNVDAGRRRLVRAEQQAERYGRHAGTIKAYRAGGSDTAIVTVRTFIFP